MLLCYFIICLFLLFFFFLKAYAYIFYDAFYAVFFYGFDFKGPNIFFSLKLVDLTGVLCDVSL